MYRALFSCKHHFEIRRYAVIFREFADKLAQQVDKVLQTL